MTINTVICYEKDTLVDVDGNCPLYIQVGKMIYKLIQTDDKMCCYTFAYGLGSKRRKKVRLPQP